MTFYHGSSVGGLNELKPVLSEHGKPYVYFAGNPSVALLYAVKPVSKPFSFYPYGFDKDRSVVYSEYYENAFFDLSSRSNISMLRFLSRFCLPMWYTFASERAAVPTGGIASCIAP